MGLAGGVAFILVFLLIFLPLADFKVAKERSSNNLWNASIMYRHIWYKNHRQFNMGELMKGTWLLTADFLCNFSCSLHHCRIIIKGINYFRLHFLQFTIIICHILKLNNKNQRSTSNDNNVLRYRYARTERLSMLISYHL